MIMFIDRLFLLVVILFWCFWGLTISPVIVINYFELYCKGLEAHYVKAKF